MYSYSIVKNISPIVSNLIYKYADNLRYLVYEGQQKKVALEREIAHIENFVDLQKFRMEEKVDVSFEKDISNGQIQIPPLLLINFIENVFKHTNDLSGFHHKIEILIKEHKGILNFISINPCPVDIKGNITNDGVGLKNALKRLELEFPNRHQISIITKEEKFKVYLTIELI